MAQEPAIDAVDDVAAEAQEPVADAAEAAAAEARNAALSRELTARYNALQQLQTSVGIYDQSLIEANRDLARLLAEVGDHETAASIYGEALQLSRINNGLYSEEQLPLADAMIESRTALEQWQEVDNLQALKLHLGSRLYQPGSSDYLAVAIPYGRWKLQTINKNLLQQSGQQRLQRAYGIIEFYNELLGQAEAGGIGQAALLPVIIDKTEADLTVAQAIAVTPFIAFDGIASPFVNQTNCQAARNSAGQVVRQCYNVQVENPNYRRSQYDAKQFELSRQMETINREVEQLQNIRQTGNLPAPEIKQLDEQITRLQDRSRDIQRIARRERLY